MAESRAEIAPNPARNAGLLTLALMWFAGIGLRLTILAVPPLLPQIHHALHLSETAVGALTALPVLLLATVAVPGAFLISRIGARRALISGLSLVALAGAGRGLGPTAPILFAMTFLMGVGVAISQPSLPTLVRQWFPVGVARATAAYSNGLLVGEILPVALTAPLIFPLVAHSWPLALPIWSIPVLCTALALAVFTPHVPSHPDAPRSAWWPNWSDATTWRLGLVVGCASASYFGANAFLPDYLKATHHAALITPSLTSLNLSQFPVSFVIAAFPRQIVGHRWPIALAGVLVAASVTGFLIGGVWVVVFSASLGFFSAAVFVLGLTLPPLIAPAHEVHRLSSAVFTIMYSCAFLGSVIGGALWDITGLGVVAFLPVFLAGVVMSILGASLHLHRPDPAT